MFVTLFRNKYRAESIRLKGYDYSQPGIYFVTICCDQKQHYFGEIKHQLMALSPIGQIAQQCWLAIPNHYPNIALDEYVVMPNHVHGLIKINYHDCHVEAQNFAPLRIADGSQNKFRVIPQSIGAIIRGYKIGVTKWCRNNNFKYFLWQRNYYEHIVRDEIELFRIQQYIKNNPKQWEGDRNNRLDII